MTAIHLNKNLEAILRSSSKIMARNGYYGTSMRDLAQATGRSLSGLYHYFENKEDLLYLINFEGFTSIQKTMNLLLEKLDDPEERLYAFIYNHISYFISHRDEMKVLMWGTQALPEVKSRVIVKLKEDYNQVAQEIVASLCKHKWKKSVKQPELARKTYFLFGAMNWIFSWYSPAKYGGIDILAKEIYTMFVAGLQGDLLNPSKEGVVKRELKKYIADAFA